MKSLRRHRTRVTAPSRTRASARIRRVWLVTAIILGALPPIASIGPASAAPCDQPIQNEIACENTKPGNPKSEWDISGGGSSNIEGFATDISVDQGGAVQFKVNTNSPNYRLDIYRMGYYGGMGARKVATVEPSASLPQNQPGCLTQATTGLVDCGNWAVSASWTVPADAVSGIYFAKLVREDATAGQNHIMFIVRDDNGDSDVLFQTSDTTWQAYNRWGGNSLYFGNPPIGRAYKVSYNRPFNTRGCCVEDWVFNAEYPMVRWLESNGYDVSYSTGVDTQRRGAELLEHDVFLSVGHDEYWSGGQRNNVEAARAAGVDLAFFSGNESFWKTRWEGSIDGSGTANRTLVTYKESTNNAKIDPDPAWTGTWRDKRFSPPSDGGRPENALTGTIFTVNGGGEAPIQVSAAEGKHRLWRNTNIATLNTGQSASLPSGILNYEWDEDLDNGSRPPGLMQMSSTPVQVSERLFDNCCGYGPGQARHSFTLYRHNGGALVFGAGTVQYSWGLDADHDRAGTPTDARMQQATVNLFADMGVQPSTLVGGLTPAAASTDAAAPTSAVTSPNNGATVTPGEALTITGTAADTGGGIVGGVEVSTDGGTTWHPANGRNNWTYSWTPAGSGTATIRSRAVDDSGNLEAAGPGITVTIGQGNQACPCSLWDSSTTPGRVDSGDGTPVELGVKIRTEVDGFISGIRYYKAAANSGTHIGNLWSVNGTRLATATFTNETSSGWQQVNFANPVPVVKDTTYIASYHAPNGHYSEDIGGLTNAVTRWPLQATADGVDGGNGVYRDGSTSGFPNSTWQATNYWVDVVFETSAGGGADTTPPTVTNRGPAPGATSVPVGNNVTATFNEPVQQATIDFTLTGPNNQAVPAAVTYDAASRTATLNPNADLAASTTYSARVAGAQDQAGNAMSAPVTWTFTTQAPPPPSGQFNCPCTIWSDTTTPAVPAENDTAAIEVGVKFRSEADGFITGVRFYKGPTNTGTHTGHLWTSGGQLLATATFTNETTSGWQQVSFSNPVAVTRNTTYVASYHSTSGRYAKNASYFQNASVIRGPLTALQNGTDGPNGVYRYGASGFPTSTWNSTNYWVDVVFETGGNDTNPPTVTGQSPAANAVDADENGNITATFNESVDPQSITFELRTAGGALVPGAVTYDAATRTATLNPTSALALSSTYTARVSGATDLAGNVMAAPVTWSFTTRAAPAPPPPPPDTGPGGPILVVAGNGFGNYYAEILRNEGLNEFSVGNTSSITTAGLESYSVVVLGEASLTSAQVSTLTTWVNSGGNLIAMRPDKQLAGLLGITDQGSTLADAYMRVDTTTGPGSGIVGQTIQYHGTADRYSTSGASTIATLYSNASTATTNPAVTLRDVGSSGGQAGMFAYDLARSVVYTRQGNPAWAGQNRDGLTPNRSNDMFFGGGGQPDWIDFNKVQIPQADEQQRLLANMILRMSRDRIPLPRFWYFPRDLKAVVIMTGDDHARGGTIGRFNSFNAASPQGCNVAQWECIRGTSYIYPNTPITDQEAAAFNAQGHEIALHPTTGCTDYTQASLDAVFTSQLADLAAAFPSIPDPTTNRTHCIVWSDWSTQPVVERAHGIRFDTNYYYYPGSWVANRPGMFTGSGMPMRFAAQNGSMIDVYQATSQMTDESGQQYPFTVDTLLDNALGPDGYYGAFTINAHTDLPTIPESTETVASAQERGVPVISARQMLTWLDGRNSSAFRSMSYSSGTLSFTIDQGASATGLRAMLPADAAGGPLTQIQRAGTPITYTTETIKGIQYAVFPAAAGAYTATYQGDTTPPNISSVSATAASNGTATITWTTNEASDSRVDYGTAPGSLTSQASNSNMTQNHSVTLSNLTPATTYHYRVTSKDAADNSATSPANPNPPATFTTPNQTLRDTTTQDFSAGTAGTGTYLSQRANGEVILTPTVGQEFSGTTLPAGWFSTAWSGGGSATVSGGALNVNGARSGTSALFGAGRSIEFSATYSGVAYQYGGFGVTFNEAPWILIGVKNDNNLYARTNNGQQTDTSAGSGWVGTPQRMRIEWNGANIVYYRNGSQFASHSVSIANQLRALFSDFTVGGGAISVDWVHMSPYATSGTFTSRVFDAGANVTWDTAPWTATTPAGTNVAISVRTGSTPTPDASWTNWQQLSGPNAQINAQARYIQYQAALSTSDPTKTPELNEVELRFSP